MKKTFKIIDITLISLLFACLVASVVAYFVKPTETKDFFNSVIEFINKPLPIAGISIALIGYELAKVFANTSLGKRQIEKTWDLIGSVKEEVGVQKNNLEQEIVGLKEQLELAKKECEKVKEYADKIATTIPNKKVNNLVEEYGKEEEVA